MDFELSEDQIALRDAAAALTDAMCASARVRAAAAEEHHFDRELWGAMAEQGWLAVERPEQDGGLGLGTVELVVLCEQLGRHLAPVPFTGTVLALGALAGALATGAADVSTSLGPASFGEWTEALAAGEAVGTLACFPDARLVSARPADGSAYSSADGPADGPGKWLVSGTCAPVLYGSTADLVVVVAHDAQGSALFALHQDPSGRPPAQPAMDVTRSIARLELQDAPAWRIGGEEAAESLLDRAAVAASAEMLGGSERVLEMTVQYAKDRVQFGRPIGSFQAVKHRCADMLVDVEGMRSSTYYAGWAVGAADPEARSAASAAKVWCSDAASRVMSSALQVHGGIGFTWEHDLHLFLKRSQLDQTSFGDAVFHRERLARVLRPKAEAGLPIL